jgi:26S proteasome regulatory subunit N9
MVGTAQEFYKTVLLFLSYTPVEELSSEDRYVVATDMAISAVVGDMIYNFGEVIATPILSSLIGSPNEWLFNLVVALSEGDINKFNSVVGSASSPYFSQPALSSFHEATKQKVVLLALMNIVYDTPAHERNIKFADIASRLYVPLNQVYRISNICCYT